MAEIGLVRFARVAMEVARAVVPAHRSKYSKRVFTQPQLLGILCLMRYEDWTYREAEVRLEEHTELRAALGLSRVPDHTTLYRFLGRLDEPLLARALAETVARLLPASSSQSVTVAVDATGLTPGSVSTFTVRRARDSGPFPWRHWTKWLVVADTDSRTILAQSARQGPINDCALLPAVVDRARALVPIGRVLADSEFDSERNHRFIREVVGADSVIPAKRGKPSWKVNGVRASMRAQFPQHLYGRRAHVENVFSVAKRKLSTRAPGRSVRTQRIQALLLGLTYNLYRLRPSLQPKFLTWTAAGN